MVISMFCGRLTNRRDVLTNRRYVLTNRRRQTNALRPHGLRLFIRCTGTNRFNRNEGTKANPANVYERQDDVGPHISEAAACSVRNHDKLLSRKSGDDWSPMVGGPGPLRTSGSAA